MNTNNKLHKISNLYNINLKDQIVNNINKNKIHNTNYNKNKINKDYNKD